MKNSNANGSTTRTPKTGTRKGPRPIMTVAQLRDAMTKELRKIDRKIAVEERKRKIAHQRAADANDSIARLAKIRSEFLAESGIKA
jgi:hypothetical protein